MNNALKGQSLKITLTGRSTVYRLNCFTSLCHGEVTIIIREKKIELN